MFKFDLQLFGGKGGSTTTVQSAPQTEQEKRLQDVQANFAEKTAPTALALQNMGSNMILSNPGVVPVNYTTMGNQAVAGAQALQNQSANLGNNISGLSSLNDLNNAIGHSLNNNLYNANSANSMHGTQSFNNLNSNQNALNYNNANSMSGLVNGQLPSAYADNQAYAINRGMNTSFGNLLADRASRGIINSSSMNSGMQGISDSVANTLSQNYNQNMQTASGMQAQNANQQQIGQNALQGLMNDQNTFNQQIYGNNANLANNQMSLNQQRYANQNGIYNDLSNNINQQNGLLSQPMALANSAQNASIDIPAKLLALSQGQQADTSSLLNTLSTNRINDKTTTQTQEGTGLLGGLLGGVGAYYGAKR